MIWSERNWGHPSISKLAWDTESEAWIRANCGCPQIPPQIVSVPKFLNFHLASCEWDNTITLLQPGHAGGPTSAHAGQFQVGTISQTRMVHDELVFELINPGGDLQSSRCGPVQALYRQNIAWGCIMATMLQPMFLSAMTLSFSTRWRRQLVALIALGLFATQASGLIHAADLDAHEGAKPCHVCKILERTGAVPPITAVVSPLLVSGEALPAYPSKALIPVPRNTRPPTRAPPR